MADTAINKLPVFVATKDGGVLPYDWLDSYALKADEESRALPPKDTFAGSYGANGLVQPLYALEVLARLSELNTWHMRCVKTRAHDAAGLGFGFEAVGEDSPQSEKETLREFFSDTRLRDAFEHVLTNIEIDFIATGCAALELVREDYSPEGSPALIAHIPSHTVRVHKSGNKYCQTKGTRKRWFKRIGYPYDVDCDSGEEYELGALDAGRRASELVWDVSYCGRSDFYGLPDILPAIGAIEGMLAAREYNIAFFRNYGVPSYLVSITGDYDLGSLVRVRLEGDGAGAIGEAFDPSNDTHTITNFEYPIVTKIREHLNVLAQNPHAPLLVAIPSATPEGKVTLEFKPLSVQVKDASFRLYRKDSRDEIIAAHGVPPYRLGLAETGSLGGSTAETSDKIYRDSVVNPRRSRLEGILNKHIVREGFAIASWRIRLKALSVEDDEQDRKAAAFLFARGGMTPNDLIRSFGEQFGLEPVDHPALDAHYIDGNPVEDLGEGEQEIFKDAVKDFQNRLLDIALKGDTG